MNLQDLYLHSRETADHRIWVFSDLQQVLPEMAEECLSIALQDMHTLGLDATRIWYLGDAMQGSDSDRIKKMIDMQVKRLSGLKIPLRYIMGNHDLDCTTSLPSGSDPILPAYEKFRAVSGWRTTDSFSDFYFTESCGDTLVVFLSDHIAQDNRWIATQQGLRGEHPEDYPHDVGVYQHLRAKMAGWPGPVIIAGHYAFPGGARGVPPGGLLERLLPLPESIKLILHGHAHTGDWPYGREKTYQRIGWVDWHDIPQLNISSLDRTRGGQTRSAVLHLHADGTLAVFFRDHEDAMWSDAYFTESTAPRSRSDASTRHHRRRTCLDDTDLARWQQQHLTE